MSVVLYLDVHVPRAIADELLVRAVDVVRAQEDGTTEFLDPELLDRATELGRVLFTQDKGFLREGAQRQRQGKEFAGIIYARQRIVPISVCIRDLELITRFNQPEDFANRVEYLPLK